MQDSALFVASKQRLRARRALQQCQNYAFAGMFSEKTLVHSDRVLAVKRYEHHETGKNTQQISGERHANGPELMREHP